ncbi:MAG: hypothetical protein H0T60_15025, partial [Acidobacteria bacterium]|nr:hypothetical protein [Acidobacteriota bacterium]
KRTAGATAWSFRNVYGGISGLGQRLENLRLADEKGTEVSVRQLAPGEFESARAATQFSYSLKLEPPTFINDAAHVSWLNGERGLLMLGDMLPLPVSKASVKFTLPAGWSVLSLDEKNSGGWYETNEAEESVFVLGRDLRERRGQVGALTFTLATAGEWAFADEDAADSINELLKDYDKIFGGSPRRRVLIALLPPARPAPANFWTAETRGGTLTLLSGRMPTKLTATAQLNGALGHELLHLWVPNALALEGNYDWFYEGFTNYLALRAGMRRGRITFQDYLSALGRAFDDYKAARGTQELSLPDASQRRWSNGTSLVYSKGMLVAFLYDLTLLNQTRGKHSVEDAYAELFRRHRSGASREDGNRAVVDVLRGLQGMRDFTLRYIQGASEINLPASVEPFGLLIVPGGVRTHVAVAESLSGAQRDLLRKLGYNDKLDAEARRLHQQMKKRLP